MTDITFLANILEPLTNSSEIYFDSDEIAAWPSSMLEALTASQLTKAAQPATSTTCDGCEQQCFMPVQLMPPSGNKPARLFIACDKRDDIGRVTVDAEKLTRQYISRQMLAEFIAERLSLPVAAICQKNEAQWHIGIFKTSKSQRPLILDTENELKLLLAGHAVPLIEYLQLKENSLLFNRNKLICLVDNPKGTDEMPEERRQRLKKQVNYYKSKGVKNFNEVVAEEEGISVSRLKQIIQGKKPSSGTQ